MVIKVKKLLVIGIISLFVGLAFIPTYNAVSIRIDIEKTNTVVDNTKEDCIDCQINGKPHLAEKLLNRLDENEVLSDTINLNNLQDDRPICILLKSLATHYAKLFYKYFVLIYSCSYGTLRYWIYYLLTINYAAMGLFILEIYNSLSCGE
ncbi:hypothetical protein AYK24_04570 [Thermoplasmatales archaeon SG8-52-4]|nr:MAG: hypothetical protein AYK24_04570 [Thermoplasmatales archaeon SG8-52-4]